MTVQTLLDYFKDMPKDLEVEVQVDGVLHQIDDIDHDSVSAWIEVSS